MADMGERRQFIANALLESCRFAYSTSASRFEGLDRKSQTFLTVSAALLAASAVLVRDGLPILRNTHPLWLVVFGLNLVVLALSVATSLLALRIRKFTGPVGPVDLEGPIKNLKAKGDAGLDSNAIVAFVEQHCSLWASPINDIADMNNCKAKLLFWSHCALLIASIGLVAIMIVVVSSYADLHKVTAE